MSVYKILFEPYLLYHLPQFIPFYDLLKNDKRFEIKFTASGHSGTEKQKTRSVLKSLGFSIIEGSTEGERWENIDRFDPDILIIGWGRRGYIQHIQERSKPRVILIYHGIGVKASYFTDNDPRIDYRAVESPYRVELLNKNDNTSELLLTGCIKLDPLYNHSQFNREKILAKFDLPPDKKTILYAPTYYPSSIGIVKQYIATATQDHNLIIKVHNYTRFHPKYQNDFQIISDIAKRYDHVRLVGEEHYNIIPLFQAADMLITDASSVIFEYLVLDRPIIVLSKHNLYLRHKLFPYYYRKKRIDTETSTYTDFYDTVKKPKHLKKCIDDVLSFPEKRSAERKKVHGKMLHFTDGQSAQRLLAYMEKILGI